LLWFRVVSVTEIAPPAAAVAGAVSAVTIRSGGRSSLVIVTVPIDGDPTA
jgi:hypothetical protein